MDNIALAFSGGGFRAACFSLGTLSYLDHLKYQGKPVLEDVKYISSTSGGSITNLVYSSFIFRGRPFAQCYTYLKQEMDGEKLIARALEIMHQGKTWKERPAKSRNLINAFSMAYDELLEREMFGLFEDRNKQPHLEEICVNSTEFTNGLPFRFQSIPPAPLSEGLIGNKFIFIKKSGYEQSRKLKLADILASSSCFPSGFEPLIFPEDYSHGDLDSEDLRNAISYTANRFTLPTDDDETFKAVPGTEPGKTDPHNSYDLLSDEHFAEKIRFGIMDGGVADNQAIDAFKKADNRRKDKKFDLFIATDVTSYLMDGYTLPLEKKQWFSRISLIGIITGWLILGVVLPFMLITIPAPWKTWMIVAGTLSGLFLAPVLYIALQYIAGLFKKNKEESSWGMIFNKYKWIFLRLRIGTVKQMILSRLKSVFILANDIYLKQIRRMYYDALFADPNYKDRSVQNAIYDLSKIKFPGNHLPATGPVPSPALIEVAEKARTMGTTLWFDSKHQAEKTKENIIAAGQFTTCYNLLKHLSKKEESSRTEKQQALIKQLTEDWDLFTKDPFRMV
jgi:hypothetical protein